MGCAPDHRPTSVLRIGTIYGGSDAYRELPFDACHQHITNAPIEVTHPSGCATKTLTANAHVEVTGDLIIDVGT